MSDAPALSVVVPFRNVEPYLAVLARSLRDQHVTDFEALLVADTPQDRSLEIAHRIAERDPRFRVIEAAGVGPGPARNLGVSESRGEFLAFADGDDLVTARGYLRMVTSLRTTGSSFAASNALRFSDDGRVWQSWTHGRSFGTEALRTHISRRPDLVGDRMVWNKVFRRDFWESAHLRFPAHLYEDLPVCLAAHLAADAVDLLSDHAYMWRERTSLDSITQALQDPGNAADRIRGVRAALEVAGRGATPIRPALEAYVREIDLPAIAALPDAALTPELTRARDDLLTTLAPDDHAESFLTSVPSAPRATARYERDEVIVEASEGVVIAVGLSTTGSVGKNAGPVENHRLTTGRGQSLSVSSVDLAATVEASSPTATMIAVVESTNGSHVSVPVLASATLPPAVMLMESAVVWGAFARGEFGARVVDAAQTASLSLDSSGLVVTLGRREVGGDIELRTGSRIRPVRRPVIDGRAHFSVIDLITALPPDDPVRRRGDALLLHDAAGTISQLYPTAMRGLIDDDGVALTLERTNQGAVVLRCASL